MSTFQKADIPGHVHITLSCSLESLILSLIFPCIQCALFREKKKRSPLFYCIEKCGKRAWQNGYSIQTNVLSHQIFVGAPLKGKATPLPLYGFIAVGELQRWLCVATQKIISGHKGGLPEASWHTADKCTFSFVDTCEGFPNRHFQFCSQALCSCFSRRLLSSRGWLWPEAGYPVFCAIVHPTCHTRSGCHLRYVCIHSACLLGPLCLCCSCQGPLGTRLEAGNPCEISIPWPLFLWLFHLDCSCEHTLRVCCSVPVGSSVLRSLGS